MDRPRAPKKAIVRLVNTDEKLFEVGYLIIECITDYFTLDRLARTCKGFRSAVKGRAHHRAKLLDLIEKTGRHIRPYYAYGEEYNPQNDQPSMICDEIQNELHSPWYFNYYDEFQNELRSPWYFNYDVYRPSMKMRMIREQLATTDLAHYGKYDYRMVVDATILPCYVCKNWKHRDLFFTHHKTAHRVLLGCDHTKRRCADCAVVFLSREEDPETFAMLGDRKRYLVDMPKGFPGFRECCQYCGKCLWIQQRPKKTRVARQVCESCFKSGLSAAKVAQRDLRKQRSPLLTGDKASLQGRNELLEDAQNNVYSSGSVDNRNHSLSFGVLSLDDGD